MVCVSRSGSLCPACTGALTLDTLSGMDRVRLGRALGYGTRHAARTVAAVVEAASASPGTSAAQPETRDRREAPETIRPVRPQTTVRTANVERGLKHLKRSVWGPLAVFSGALWLRVTGLFFGLIAFTVGAGAWRLRNGWQRAFMTPEGTRFWLFAGVAALFAYFAVSSFVRANLKERRAEASRAS